MDEEQEAGSLREELAQATEATTIGGRGMTRGRIGKGVGRARRIKDVKPGSRGESNEFAGRKKGGGGYW